MISKKNKIYTQNNSKWWKAEKEISNKNQERNKQTKKNHTKSDPKFCWSLDFLSNYEIFHVQSPKGNSSCDW